MKRERERDAGRQREDGQQSTTNKCSRFNEKANEREELLRELFDRVTEQLPRCCSELSEQRMNAKQRVRNRFARARKIEN